MAHMDCVVIVNMWGMREEAKFKARAARIKREIIIIRIRKIRSRVFYYAPRIERPRGGPYAHRYIT